jgi:hypothetical protein
LNAGNLLLNEPIYHVDHPGTTVHLFFALIIFLAYFLFNFSGDLPNFVTENADQLILIYQITFSIVFTIFSFVIFNIIRKRSNYIAAFFFTFSYVYGFGSYANVAYWTSPTPDSMAILLSSAIITVTFIFKISESRKILVLGILMGCILMTKLNAIPFILVTLVLCKSLSDYRRFLKTFIPTLIIWIVLINENFSRFVKWSGNLVRHSGQHGSNSSFIQLQDMLGNLEKTKTILFPLIILLLVMLRNKFSQKKSNGKLHTNPEFILLIILFLGYISVLRTGVLHYFLPFWPLVGFLFANYFSIGLLNSAKANTRSLLNNYVQQSDTHGGKLIFDYFLYGLILMYLECLIFNRVNSLGTFELFLRLFVILIFVLIAVRIELKHLLKNRFLPLRPFSWIAIVFLFIIMPFNFELKMFQNSRELILENNRIVREFNENNFRLIGDNTPTKYAALKFGNGFAGATFTEEIQVYSNNSVFLQEIPSLMLDSRTFNLVDSRNNEVLCKDLDFRNFDKVRLIITNNSLLNGAVIERIKIRGAEFSEINRVSETQEYILIDLLNFSCL